MDTEQAAEYFLSEIDGRVGRNKVHKTGISRIYKNCCSGNAGKIPPTFDGSSFYRQHKKWFVDRNAHGKGADIEKFVDYFEQMGLQPGRLVICHIDKRPDPVLHKELARAGYLLEYDTFFRPKYEPEKYLWPLILDMVNSGFSKSIALATDLADSTLWAVYGQRTRPDRIYRPDQKKAG